MPKNNVLIGEQDQKEVEEDTSKVLRSLPVGNILEGKDILEEVGIRRII